MLVVSNFVPSYLKKQEVRFITDLELYRWIENGDAVFYKSIHLLAEYSTCLLFELECRPG